MAEHFNRNKFWCILLIFSVIINFVYSGIDPYDYPNQHLYLKYYFSNNLAVNTDNEHAQGLSKFSETMNPQDYFFSVHEPCFWRLPKLGISYQTYLENFQKMYDEYITVIQNLLQTISIYPTELDQQHTILPNGLVFPTTDAMYYENNINIAELIARKRCLRTFGFVIDNIRLFELEFKKILDCKLNDYKRASTVTFSLKDQREDAVHYQGIRIPNSGRIRGLFKHHGINEDEVVEPEPDILRKRINIDIQPFINEINTIEKSDSIKILDPIQFHNLTYLYTLFPMPNLRPEIYATQLVELLKFMEELNSYTRKMYIPNSSMNTKPELHPFMRKILNLESPYKMSDKRVNIIRSGPKQNVLEKETYYGFIIRIKSYGANVMPFNYDYARDKLGLFTNGLGNEIIDSIELERYYTKKLDLKYPRKMYVVQHFQYFLTKGKRQKINLGLMSGGGAHFVFKQLRNFLFHNKVRHSSYGPCNISDSLESPGSNESSSSSSDQEPQDGEIPIEYLKRQIIEYQIDENSSDDSDNENISD